MNLSSKTAIGFFWNFAEQLSKRGIGIVVTLLLARFLTPDDYGLMAIIGVFLAIAYNFMDLGFNQAIIRKHNATEDDFSTAFYANLAMGFCSYIMLFISAPLIAAFYEEPRLIILIRVIGIAILINPFQSIQTSILSRNLNFKAQLKAAVPAAFISGIIAVIMAYMGFGVWALISQTILSTLIITIFLWFISAWKPTLVFNQKSLSEMLGFSLKLFLSDLLDTIFRNIYLVVIAKLFTAAIAGRYFFATKITELIFNQLVNSIQKVTYPVLAILQEDDVRLKAGYKKVIQVTTFALFPILAIVASLAQPMFIVFLSDQWLPAVPYLQLMCIAGMVYPLQSINLNILKVKGRSDLFLYLQTLNKLIIVIILSMSLQFGIMGILTGQIISSLLSYLPISYYSGKIIDYPVKEQIFDFLPGLILSITNASLIYFLIGISTYPPLIELILFGTLAGGIYIVTSYVFKLEALKITEKLMRENLKKDL